MTAASRPRFSLSTSDSCGVCIAGVTSDAVRTGLVGSLMSRTATPVGALLRLIALVGKSSVVS
jgi:hypothetical protein